MGAGLACAGPLVVLGSLLFHGFYLESQLSGYADSVRTAFRMGSQELLKDEAVKNLVCASMNPNSNMNVMPMAMVGSPSGVVHENFSKSSPNAPSSAASSSSSSGSRSTGGGKSPKSPVTAPGSPTAAARSPTAPAPITPGHSFFRANSGVVNGGGTTDTTTTSGTTTVPELVKSLAQCESRGIRQSAIEAELREAVRMLTFQLNTLEGRINSLAGSNTAEDDDWEARQQAPHSRPPSSATSSKRASPHLQPKSSIHPNPYDDAATEFSESGGGNFGRHISSTGGGGTLGTLYQSKSCPNFQGPSSNSNSLLLQKPPESVPE